MHGWAWRAGTKTDVGTSGGTGTSVPPQFIARGIAFASVDFRQSTDAPFPAMVYDIKASTRFLRAKAAEYGYRSDRIAIGGMSSGGHLAALVGVTNGDQELEGKVGNYLNQSQCSGNRGLFRRLEPDDDSGSINSGERHNNRLQRTALRAAAEPERYAAVAAARVIHISCLRLRLHAGPRARCPRPSSGSLPTASRPEVIAIATSSRTRSACGMWPCRAKSRRAHPASLGRARFFVAAASVDAFEVD